MSRNYCFTFFGEKEWDVNDDIRYIVWQVEECPETKRRHCQGYVQFRKQVRLRKCTELLGGGGVHVEVARGSADQCRAYCTKVETRVAGPFEKGIMCEGARVRTDIAQLSARIAEGDQMDAADYLMYGNRIDMARRRCIGARDPNDPVEVHILWGDPGVGKTRAIWEAHGEGIYWGDLAPKWWDGYDGEEIVLLDEFDIDEWPRSVMLRLFDRYPYRVQQKGGSIQMVATKFYLTMNRAQYERFRDKACEALLRRITSTRELIAGNV